MNPTLAILFPSTILFPSKIIPHQTQSKSFFPKAKAKSQAKAPLPP
jgi:hypothetical protein